MLCGHLEPKKYRVAIDFFLLPSSQRQKKSIFSLRSLRLCGENEKRNQILFAII
jgi:hypothetical protein